MSSLNFNILKNVFQNRYVYCKKFTRSSVTRLPSSIIPGKYPKYCSAEEATDCIKSGDNLFVQGAAVTPTTLLHALKQNILKKKLKDLRAYHIHMEGEGVLTSPELNGIVKSNSLFTGPNCRKAVFDGTADFIPTFLSNIPSYFRKEIFNLDAALIQVSPPDEHGFVSLGTSVDITLAACEKANTLIAHVNKNVPRSFGDGLIHMSHLDYVVELDQDLYTSHEVTPSAEEIAIGKYIANELVEDGSTLQMGIGNIPNAVMSQIVSQRNLGIHSEMVSDSLVRLVLEGIVNNSNKKLFRGKTVSSFAIGTKILYDFINNNPSFLMLDVAFTNNPYIIAQNPKIVAINSCIEVDLTGQVVSDSIGKKIHSGVGGQVDFLSGAIFSTDGLGKPILAMLSQTKRNESKIVPTVKDGAGVTTSRNHANYIVTEYGIAVLAGKSLRQRAYELIKIAHPNHRESLEKAAFDRLKAIPSKD